jgi:hypothetical protein
VAPSGAKSSKAKSDLNFQNLASAPRKASGGGNCHSGGIFFEPSTGLENKQDASSMT